MKRMILLSLSLITSFAYAGFIADPRIVVLFDPLPITDPLMKAVNESNKEKARELIAAGADVNLPRIEVPFSRNIGHIKLCWFRPDLPDIHESVSGKILDATCLMLAILNNDCGMVSFLIEQKADVNALVSVDGVHCTWIWPNREPYEMPCMREEYQSLAESSDSCIFPKPNTQSEFHYTAPVCQMAEYIAHSGAFTIYPGVIALLKKAL